MTDLIRTFRIELLRRLRSGGFRIFLAVALALSLAMVLSPAAPQAAIRVGLVLPEEGAALEQLLLEQNDELICFIPTDEQTLDRQVLAGRWDCGLVAHEDFAEKLAELDTRNILTLKTGPGSTVYPLVRETVAACLFRLTAPAVARDYLAGKQLDTSGLEALQAQLEQSTQRVDVILRTTDGSALSLPELTSAGGRRVLRGLVAVLALVWGLYLASDLGRFLASGSGQRLRSLRPDWWVLLPRLLAALLPVALWAIAALWWLEGWRAALSFPAFLAPVLGLGLVLPRHRRLWEPVTGLMPFLVLTSLLLEPVLTDVTVLFPELAPWLRWLPVTLFCRACDGSLTAALFLLLEGAALAVLSLPQPKKTP